MHAVRSSFRTPCRRFGRRAPVVHAAPLPPQPITDDLRLFLLSFAGGLLFMTVYLA